MSPRESPFGYLPTGTQRARPSMLSAREWEASMKSGRQGDAVLASMDGMTPRLRRAGSPWRLLVHEAGQAGASHHLTNRPSYGGTAVPADAARRTHVLEATEFDELAVGRWLHIEQMDPGHWWMNIGGVTVHVEVDRDGRPRHVELSGPADPTANPECTYHFTRKPHDSESGADGTEDDGRAEHYRVRVDPGSRLVRPGVVRCGLFLIHSRLLSSDVGC